MKGPARLACTLLLSVIAWGLPAAAAGADAAGHGVQAVIDRQELRIDFPEAMQAWDNAGGSGLVGLQPALAVECHWASDTRLSCRPGDEARFALATRYRITLPEGLATQAGARLPAVVLHAETARPVLRAVIAQWNEGLPRIELTANAEVDAAAVGRVLRLEVDGRAQPLPPLDRLPPRGPWDTGLRFAMELPGLEGQDRLVRLAVVPGLRSSEGPLPGLQDHELLLALARERYRVRGIRCSGRSGEVVAEPDGAGRVLAACLPGEYFALSLSAPSDPASRAAFEAALPEGVELLDWSGYARPFRAHGEGPAVARGEEILLHVAAAQATVALDAALAELRAAGDGAALAPVSAAIRTGDHRPQLHAPRVQALLADGRRPPVLLEAVNVQLPLQVPVVALGAGEARSEVVGVPPAAARNRFGHVGSDAAARALAEGGWARWQLPPGAERWRATGPQVDVAAPGFDLVAVFARREVLAWAREWDGRGAVAGARVELLRLRGKDAPGVDVVARAVTGDDGVARLELPADFEASGAQQGTAPAWILRAETGARRGVRRAVLRSDLWRNVLGVRAPVKTWGVADRPLYRAGATVRYRLWQRSDDGGRLLRLPAPATPVELGLYSLGEGKLIKGWTATPAADGSIAGELVLPVHAPDDTYCIGTGESWNVEGTCFFVGTYRAQDLWVAARAEDRVLGDGDRFVVDVEAGYYSSGAAAGVPVPKVTALLTGRRLEDEYPAWASFSFVAPGAGGIPLQLPEGEGLRTDAEGRLRIELPLGFDADAGNAAPGSTPPAFGQLQLVAEARPDDREGTASNAARARYARHARYVGLRLHPRWPVAGQPVEVEAVVIDAAGEAVEGAPVEVEVHYLPGFAADAAPEGGALARCALAGGARVACDFPRARSGRYRFTARSEGAAAVELSRYIHVDGGSAAADPGPTALELLEAPAAQGAPLRVQLRQPHAQARVLLVYSSGDTLLGHRVEDMHGHVASWLLPSPDTRARAVTLTAYVLDAAGAPVVDGYRQPAALSTASVSFSPPRPAATAPLALAFDADRARPGSSARITLRNDGDHPRDVVLAVVDDALRALGSDFLEYFDPEGAHWLGSLEAGRYPRALPHSSFTGWRGAAVRVALPWPLGDGEDAGADAPGGAPGSAGQPSPLPPPAPPAPPPPGEAPVVFDAPSPMDTPAPAPMPSIIGGAELDRIEVTGSRIDPAGLFVPGSGPLHGLRPREPGQGRPQPPAARVRTRFADTALWQPAIRLAPGEERSIELELPDNLTRWRAVAWSSDADDGFHMAEATLETGLPLEVRLQAPVRIYPGDAARVAANLRQSGDGELRVEGRMVADGLGPPASTVESMVLPPRGQAAFAMGLAPAETGRLSVTASAEGGGERDAVAAVVEVASPVIEARRLQAGWLQAGGAVLDVPALPPGAADPRLQLRLHRGVDALVTPWTRDLREYPHRCWEQVLSRAVAAALAIERDDVADWPDAPAVVQEALDNAAVFQDAEGGFRFFAGTPAHGHGGQASRVTLAAYTVRVFGLLRELGYGVPTQVDASARRFLQAQRHLGTDVPDRADLIAFAAAAHPEAVPVDAAWAAWESLSLPARIAATRALAATGQPAAAEGVARLLASAPERGGARVLALPGTQARDPWMSSRLREQCALVELLGEHPRLAAAGVRSSLVAGLRDLYAGGVRSLDTQAGAQCLLALRDLARPASREDIAVWFEVGGTSSRLVLPAAEASAERGVALADEGRAVLRIAPEAPLPEAGASYVAELRYREDARQARASAVGLSIARRHEVLRDGGWQPVGAAGVREGDWLRVTLVVENSASRYYVALADAVPGGLQPTDLALGGIAGLDLARVSSEGSHWFGTRRLDPRAPRFYAEWLPAGRHELHYFARAGNAGDYLAAPAVAELMYGDASAARTGAARLRIRAGGE